MFSETYTVVAMYPSDTATQTEENKTLTDVVVTGYKSQVRQEITGSVTSVKMDKITESQASESFSSLLQGRVAGMFQLAEYELG